MQSKLHKKDSLKGYSSAEAAVSELARFQTQTAAFLFNKCPVTIDLMCKMRQMELIRRGGPAERWKRLAFQLTLTSRTIFSSDLSNEINLNKDKVDAFSFPLTFVICWISRLSWRYLDSHSGVRCALWSLIQNNCSNLFLGGRQKVTWVRMHLQSGERKLMTEWNHVAV